MTESMSTARRGRAGISRRFALAIGLIVLVVAIGIAMFAAGRRLADPKPIRLSAVLAQTIATQGITATASHYRSLRGQGFPGVQESESDTNRLGYELLGKNENESAIAVFQLNVETHPQSANVYDSLAEAYLAAGNKALAIANYQQAVAINPKKKTAVYELQRLTDSKGKSYPPLLRFHIGAGTLGLLSGALAMALRKGSRRHRVAGRVFVVSMLSMSASAVYMALKAPDGEVINILMGMLTFYLVATAWLTAWRREGNTGIVDWAALLVVLAVAAGLVRLGLSGGRFGGVSFFFAAVALLAAALDLRMIVRRGVVGVQRIARHLWRMGFALYIAVTSLFLGQSQIFPYAVRETGLLVVPVVLVAILLIFWLIRVLFSNAYKRAAAHRKFRPLDTDEPGVAAAVRPLDAG